MTHGYGEDQGEGGKQAKAKPWEITVSVDGVGDVHANIHGRVKFWDRTARSIETMERVRQEHNLRFIPYLQDPDRHRMSVQMHAAHERIKA